ncbi:MAG: cytochrome-c peroxidase [Elusimicrobia bacterium]|nr:cytochrome-c peroxidase [Elusimicrobiota bacterium]
MKPLLALLLAAVPCAAHDPDAPADAEVRQAYARIDGSAILRLDKHRPRSPAEVELGKRLFFDPRLSSDRKMSCSTCHVPEKAWTDGLARARGRGGKTLLRNTPTVLDLRGRTLFFRDGRVARLSEQVLLPIQDHGEMGAELPEILGRLRAVPEYRDAFRQAYGRDADASGLAEALTAFVESLETAADSPFDRGRRDPTALPPSARRGLLLFSDKAHCLNCHKGPLFSDEHFHKSRPEARRGARGSRPLDRAAHDAELRGVPDAKPAQRRADRSLHARRAVQHAQGGRRFLRPRGRPPHRRVRRAEPAQPERSREAGPGGLPRGPDEQPPADRAPHAASGLGPAGGTGLRPGLETADSALAAVRPARARGARGAPGGGGPPPRRALLPGDADPGLPGRRFRLLRRRPAHSGGHRRRRARLRLSRPGGQGRRGLRSAVRHRHGFLRHPAIRGLYVPRLAPRAHPRARRRRLARRGFARLVPQEPGLVLPGFRAGRRADRLRRDLGGHRPAGGALREIGAALP